MTIPLKLSSIITDEGTQIRAKIDNETVASYADDMKKGDKFPPVVVFKNGERYLLADGFHRVEAAKKNEYPEIMAEVRDGDRSAAIKFALQANATNGLRRTNADKRNAVIIADKEYSHLSNKAIAELCMVSDMLVKSVRDEKSEGQESGTSTRTGQDGKKYPAKKKNSRAKRSRKIASAQLSRVKGVLVKAEPDERGKLVTSILKLKKKVLVPSKQVLQEQFQSWFSNQVTQPVDAGKLN